MVRKRKIGLLAGLGFGLAAIVAAPGLSLAGNSFIGFGSVDGYGNTANAVSGGGHFVVGNGSYPGLAGGETEALRWTSGGGIQFLGDLPSGITRSMAMGVSADGNVVVGEGRYGADVLQYEAFRWTPGTGIVGLGFLPGGTRSTAAAVSGDGTIIVGQGFTGTGLNEAFRWTEAGGMQGLGGLVAGGASFAFDISHDGSTVVGAAHSGVRTEAAYWTESGGWTSIGKLPGGLDGLGASATDASADGAVIGGYSSSTLIPFAFEAFRWTESDGMEALGLLQPDHGMSVVTGMSADGQTLVGVSGPTSGINRRPYIWDEAHGMRDLQVVLEDQYGLDLTGWTLLEVLDISQDGKTFVGYGASPRGVVEGWVATIPEPSALTLLAFAGMTLIRRRQR